MQGTVKRGRRQGRQRKRWEDNIREQTGLEFGRSQRAVEDREKWRKLVAKSSGAPTTLVVKGLMMMMYLLGKPCLEKQDLLCDLMDEFGDCFGEFKLKSVFS